MENKIKKRSINSVIYLLLAAMLVGVIGVSIYTVESRRKPVNPDTGSQAADSSTDDTSSQGTTNSQDSTAPDTTSSDTTATDTSADTTAKDTAASATRDDVPASINVRYFVQPAVGTVAKDFEIDIPVYSMTMNDYRAHIGVDIAAPLGSEVVSASSGIVCRLWSDPLMGRSITIDHGDGIYTTYKNLAEEVAPKLEIGTSVSMGQVIGAIGESALIEIAEEPHLHFEMQVNGEYVDPLEYIQVDAMTDQGYES